MMTMQARPGVVVRQPSERAVTGDRGSVLQTLRDLSPAPACEEPRASASRGPSPAFLPARPDDASQLEPTSTGVIDVRELAAAGQRLGMAPPTAPGFSLAKPPHPVVSRPPVQPPSVPPVSTTPVAPRAPSTLFLQARAFVLGALCAGALTGSIVLAAAWTATSPSYAQQR